MRIDLLDDDGENRAVRSFLLAYGGNTSMTVGEMKCHMDMSGWENAWPDWVKDARDEEHLTKGGAQNWIRYLFDMEKSSETVAEEVIPKVEVDDEPAEYHTGDEDLDHLLELTDDMARFGGNMDTGLYWFDVLTRVSNKLKTATNTQDVVDAERWRAFLNTARVKFFGWAGVDVKSDDTEIPTDNYVHFGAEFWTIHDTETSPYAQKILTTYADAAVRLSRAKQEETSKA